MNNMNKKRSMYISRSTATDMMIFFLMNRSSNIKLNKSQQVKLTGKQLNMYCTVCNGYMAVTLF